MNKVTVFSITLFLLLTSLLLPTSRSQTIDLLGGNTLNGAMNGVMLGGATMALQNSSDFDPVRVGLGAGTLYGIAVGVYDISTVKTGEQFFISGVFNDGTNTSIIVLLDTFYGAASGAVIASSISLIAKEPIVDALQYGTSVGAWAGFGFGLIDAFMLSQRPGSSSAASTKNTRAEGLITYTDPSSRVEAGFLSPAYISFTEVDNNRLGVKHALNIEMVNISIRL